MRTGEMLSGDATDDWLLVDVAHLETLREIAGDEPQGRHDLSVLVETFIEDGRRRTEALVTAIQRRDVDEVERLAHDLGGSSANLGAIAVADRCRLLGRQATSGELDRLAGSVAGLLDDFDTSAQVIRRYLGLPVRDRTAGK